MRKLNLCARPIRSGGPIIALLIVSLASADQVRAQRTPTPEEVDAVFAQWDRPGSPGCVVGVIREGQFVYKRAYGYANLDWDVPLTPSATFYMASASKQFVAAAIALLAQEGRLSLDDDIRSHLPELPQYRHTVTIRHLIHHTGGIRDVFPLLAVAGVRIEHVQSIEDLFRLIAREPLLDFQPGTQHRYSNSGYHLLSVIVERASGQSLKEFTRQRIFEPLGMQSTHFHDNWTHVVKRRAMGYRPRQGGGFSLAHLGTLGLGMYTSVEDLLHWDNSFLDPKIGGEGFNELLLTRGVLTTGDTLDYAFGLRVENYRETQVIHHDGNFMGLRHFLLRIPEKRLSVICLCNLQTIDARDLAEKVADLYGAWEEGHGSATLEEHSETRYWVQTRPSQTRSPAMTRSTTAAA